MGLRDAVQADVGAALATVVHALALQVFYPGYGLWTPLQLRLSVSGLERLAPGVDDGPAGRRVRDRCEAWGARLPERAENLWGFTLWAMLPDAIDYGAQKGGPRMEALTTAIFVMVLKCASGVSAPLLALPLARASYGNATDLAEISSVIVSGMCLIPTTGAALCDLLLLRWRPQTGASADSLASAEGKDHD